MYRRFLYLTLCCAFLLFSSCIKSLEEEGIYGSTRCYGVVLDGRTHQPLQDMRVSITDGMNYDLPIRTEADGRFEVSVGLDKLANNYYIAIDADSLYERFEYMLNKVPRGAKEFDLDTIYLVGPNYPAVVTSNVIDITAISAHAFGSTENSGNSSILEQGFVYSTMQYPTIDNEVAVASAYSTDFDCVLPLRPNTTYYIRAYARNGVGIGYGDPIEITTQNGLAVVSTDSVTAISSTVATCGGRVLSDAGFHVNARGLCWSTSPNPTISNAHTVEGAGLGSFSSGLNNLEPNKTYYVRAYAQNSSGIAYGNQVSFTTLSGLPVVTTAMVSSVSSTHAVVGGEVLSDGGFPVVSRGICYGESPQPTLSDHHTTDGVGLGEYVSHLVNLVPGTSYYYRACATNGVGTVYGEQYVFVAW